MKKRLFSLVLVCALALSLAPSAFAASTTTAQALAAYASYFSAGGQTRDMPDNSRPVLRSFFYVDFNKDGIPELMRYFGTSVEQPADKLIADVFCVTGSGDALSVQRVAVFGTGSEYELFTLAEYGGGTYGVVQRKVPASEYDLLGNPIHSDPIEDHFFFSNGTFTKGEKRNFTAVSGSGINNRYGLLNYKPTVVISSQKLKVNGQEIQCEKYNIDGSNYFKLRDIAKLMSGTANQFSVGYDQKSNLITISRGASYTPNGTELFIDKDHSDSAVISTQTISVDGVTVSDLSTFNIGGNNYFKLRDLGDKFGFNVGWDAATSTVVVTSTDYKG